MFKKLDCLQLINFIEKSFLFRTGKIRHKKILIAFSGGQDSSCLLAIFYILKKKWKFELGVVYCNHCWNPSVKPAFEVFQILQKYNLPFYFVEAPNSTAIKPEQAARNWRYSAFYTILKEESYDFVLTGHSLSDCSETALFNLVRGSGLKGICSLKEYQIFQMPLVQKLETSLTYPKQLSLFNLKSNFFSTDQKVSAPKFFHASVIFRNYFKSLSKKCFPNLNFRKGFKITEKKKENTYRSYRDETVFTGKKKKVLNLTNKEKFLPIDPKPTNFFGTSQKLLYDKQDFNFKKTTFFADSFYNFSLILKFNSNFEKKNQFKSFCKLDFLNFKFALKAKNTMAKKTRTAKKAQVVETLFSAYLQRLKKFQKLDQSSSLISCFKPSKLKGEKNFFFNPFLDKLITKKEKEIPTFFSFLSKNFGANQKVTLINQNLFQNFWKTNKNKKTVVENFDFKRKLNFLRGKRLQSELLPLSFQQSKAYEKKVFLSNLQKNEFLVFRPLIKINRENLFLFSKTLKLPICYDPSNKNLNLTRNSIRKLIIPLLKKINPSAEENIYRFSRILEFYYELLGNIDCPPDRLEIFTL
uniref:tRNA(Ile)-lysidine synthase, chloroplastic n=1 Tax=Gloeotilopsis planctonica TaxID=34157 RepID=A0A1B2RZ70_9CHLO|nr:hypothetical chloroplast RF62 [Gloeotilopsis planctonica]